MTNDAIELKEDAIDLIKEMRPDVERKAISGWWYHNEKDPYLHICRSEFLRAAEYIKRIRTTPPITPEVRERCHKIALDALDVHRLGITEAVKVAVDAVLHYMHGDK